MRSGNVPLIFFYRMKWKLCIGRNNRGQKNRKVGIKKYYKIKNLFSDYEKKLPFNAQSDAINIGNIFYRLINLGQ